MNSPRQKSSITLAMTGASGAAYGLRLLECLVDAGEKIDVLVSLPGQIVIGMETDWDFPARPAEQTRFLRERFNTENITVYGKDQWTAPVASGSGVARAMVVCPCTTGTLSAIATGASNNLMERAADVVLKERQKLILVVRETPLSDIHLENMLKLSRMGAVILPANPGFYHKPRGLDDLVDFVVARILDQLDIEHNLLPRWGDEE
ncbi:MAG TPA: UbiX family flavin prenyltransferase [Gammaproteobacteria bacterium]|nr:UbiX family flavin prenyltransferase [Gammaproteobacteria bacterium]